MTVPDNELIAEVLLVSEGFRTSRDLARKMVSLFALSRELLSPQQHYDWGLRALKTSLGIAGAVQLFFAVQFSRCCICCPTGCILH